MALKLPTTLELFLQYLAQFESDLNQTSPLNDKAFLRVLAAIEAAGDQGNYKYAAERALQNLAITATGADLDRIGAEYDTPRTPAESAVLTATLPGINGTIIPQGTSFTGDANGERYFSDSAATITGGVATITMTAENAGTLGNLQVADKLTIGTQIAGAESTATVTAIVTTGADEETDEEYRPRVLTAIRAACGGGNATDYKIWAEGVAGVFRAFPYAGRPTGTDFPGDRTVYVEADSSIDPDGIAPQSLLDDVRDDLNYDPDTGESRPPLGLEDSTLFVESITRTGFFTEIRNLQIDPADEAAAKADIATSLDLYYRGITPFVDGIDPPQERDDTITDLTVSTTVQDVLTTYGATADGIGFGLSPSTFLPSYLLAEGELAKNSGVTYV